jgi:hypothetical protein
MTNPKVLLAGLATAATLTVGAAGAAHADRYMVVLVDASGSMTIERSDDGRSRFQAAIDRADTQIFHYATNGGLDGVAVYAFSGTTAILHTGTPPTAGNPGAPFVDVNTARAAVAALTTNQPPAGLTPLAGSVCEALDTLLGMTAGNPERILQLASDGEENNTPIGTECQGPRSETRFPPFQTMPQSWENKVYVKATDVAVGSDPIILVDLFEYSEVTGPLFSFSSMVPKMVGGELIVPRPMQKAAAAAAAADPDRPPTLREFFGALTSATGGSLTVIPDAEPVPVIGDIDGDQCIDPADTFEIIRRFGEHTPDVDGKYDLDLDGVITYDDYAILASYITGTCGEPDDQVARQAVVCQGSRSITIENAAIETTGIGLDVFGSCRVTIRNSRIVAGNTAIRIRGAATVTIDDSVVAGMNAVIGLTGAAALSAGTTYFKGEKLLVGAFGYIDRGGNTWE